MKVSQKNPFRQVEVTAARTMIERTEERFELTPERLAADTAYGPAEILNLLVDDRVSDI